MLRFFFLLLLLVAPVLAEEFDSNGVKIHYQVMGQGEPVILVHGAYASINSNWVLPGTAADREGMAYMTAEFERLGLKVEHFPYLLPEDWRPTDFGASYQTADGKTITLETVFPVADTKATGPRGVTAEAVWVGIGSGADFIGRDVKGKAVVIYSTLVPGGRSHSASDRAGLFNANTRAVKVGAAVVAGLGAHAVLTNFRKRHEIGEQPGESAEQAERDEAANQPGNPT